MTRKNHSINIMLSESDRKEIDKRAKKLGMKTSTYMRMVSLNVKIKSIPIQK